MEKPKYKTPRGASATAAKNKYRDANYDRAELALPKGMKEQARAHAESRGETLNKFITRAISEQMERDEQEANFLSDITRNITRI